MICSLQFDQVLDMRFFPKTPHCIKTIVAFDVLEHYRQFTIHAKVNQTNFAAAFGAAYRLVCFYLCVLRAMYNTSSSLLKGPLKDGGKVISLAFRNYLFFEWKMMDAIRDEYKPPFCMACPSAVWTYYCMQMS